MVMVKVTAIDAPEPVAKRRIGSLKGKITVPDDFDTMGQEEIERMVQDAAVPASAPTLPPADAPRPAPEELERVFEAHGQVNLGPPLGPLG